MDHPRTTHSVTSLWLTFLLIALLLIWPRAAAADTHIFTDFTSFFTATGSLTEIDFEGLPGNASSNLADLPDKEFIPNPLTLDGVIFTAPEELATTFCVLPACQPDPHNSAGGNNNLLLQQGAIIDLPVGTGGVMLVVQGMGDVPFSLQVTGFDGSSITINGQAVANNSAYLGFTSANGIRQVIITEVGPTAECPQSACSPLVLSALYVELSDPDVTIGVWADPANDVASPHADMVFGSAMVNAGIVDLRVQFQDPPFSIRGTQKMTWCFNTDQNASTGAACGYTGADKAFTLSGTSGGLFGGPLSFTGALASLDPCAVGSYNWDTKTLRLVFPLSLLSGINQFHYTTKSILEDEYNDMVYTDIAPGAVNFMTKGKFFTSIAEEFAPFDGTPLCLPYQETTIPVQVTGAVAWFPELNLRYVQGEGVQSTYFRTTPSNREFRRGFVEFKVPAFPAGLEISHAALILTETRGQTSFPLPPDTHKVAYYPADLVITEADYDRPATPVMQTFETDSNLPPQTFAVDVTDAIRSANTGAAIGFRIKLQVDPDYQAEGFAGSGFGERYSYAPPRILVRLADTLGNVSPETGGSLSHTNAQGIKTEVVAPAGAVNHTTRLAYDTGLTTAAGASLPLDGSALTAANNLVRLKSTFTLEAYQQGRPQSDSVLEKPIRVTIYYHDADVPLIYEATLTLNYWNGSAWEYAACGPYERHPEANWLAVPVCHVSEFALFGLRDAPYRNYVPLMLKKR